MEISIVEDLFLVNQSIKLTKICKLAHVLVHKHICSPQVSMDDVIVVQMFHATQNAFSESLYCALVELVPLNHFLESDALDVFLANLEMTLSLY